MKKISKEKILKLINSILNEGYDVDNLSFDMLLLVAQKLIGIIGLLQLYFQNHKLLSIKINALRKSRKADELISIIKDVINRLDYLNS